MGTEDTMSVHRWLRTNTRRYYRPALIGLLFFCFLLTLLTRESAPTTTTPDTPLSLRPVAVDTPTDTVDVIMMPPVTHAPTPLPPIIPLPTAPPLDLFDPTDHATLLPDRVAETHRRRLAVVTELRHSYHGYETYAFGHDELKPISRAYKDWSHDKGGLSVTMIDSLSTLWIAGLHEEFARAVEHIRTKLSWDVDVDVSHFEATIRLVGGLLSAYELSDLKHMVLLEKAKELMDRLLPAYRTMFHIPHSVINLKHGNSTGLPWQGYASPLAEYGTVHLELRALAYHTQDPKYSDAAQRINSFLLTHCPGSQLCPTLVHPDEGHWVGDLVTLGGLGDSYYEYLLKQWLHTGKQDLPTLHRFVRAAASIVEFLVVNQSGFVYVTQRKADYLVHRMDHLACFVPGMFVLASRTVPWGSNAYFAAVSRLELPNDLRSKLMASAEGILETCWRMYNDTKSKLGAEVVIFNEEGTDDGNPNYMRVWRHHQPYLLRPEVIESMYYMWVHTHDPKWQDRAWQIFRAIRHYCRVPHGYTGVTDVTDLPPVNDDVMQSFWIAETLKYLFLIFSEDVATQEKFLEEWVFNTEAHPLRIRKDYYDRFPLQV